MMPKKVRGLLRDPRIAIIPNKFLDPVPFPR